jgi:hypothetical protein
LAGFEVTLYGRIWVTPEDLGAVIPVEKHFTNRSSWRLSVWPSWVPPFPARTCRAWSLEPFAHFLEASLEPFVELRAVFYQRPQQIDTGSNNLHFFVSSHAWVSPQEIFPLMDDAKNFAGLYFQSLPTAEPHLHSNAVAHFSVFKRAVAIFTKSMS